MQLPLLPREGDSEPATGYASLMTTVEFEVIPCPAELRPAAIRQLHDALPVVQRAVFIAALDAVGVSDEAAWDGLVIAKPQAAGAANSRGAAADRVDVAWLQPLPGKTACVWLADPLTAGGAALLRRMAELGGQSDIALLQYIVDEDRPDLAEAMSQCGFVRLVELDYLFVDLFVDVGQSVGGDDSRSANEAPAGLQFVSHAASNPARLAKILDATYAGTHDCPALDGVRRIDDVVEGYKAVGRFVPEHWYVVERDGRYAGVLILADHGDVGNWEVVYMGVVPEARGHGLGRQIVRHAQRVAAHAGGERLVLAVDVANAPALAVYRDAGFVEWCRRTVYAWLGNPPAGV